MRVTGRDFHTFNVCFRDDPASHVITFTAAQIPAIEKRRCAPTLIGPPYLDGMPIYLENKFLEMIHE